MNLLELIMVGLITELLVIFITFLGSKVYRAYITRYGQSLEEELGGFHPIKFPIVYRHVPGQS